MSHYNEEGRGGQQRSQPEQQQEQPRTKTIREEITDESAAFLAFYKYGIEITGDDIPLRPLGSTLKIEEVADQIAESRGIPILPRVFDIEEEDDQKNKDKKEVTPPPPPPVVPIPVSQQRQRIQNRNPIVQHPSPTSVRRVANRMIGDRSGRNRDMANDGNQRTISSNFSAEYVNLLAEYWTPGTDDDQDDEDF